MNKADRNLYMAAARGCAAAHFMCEQLRALGYITDRERAKIAELANLLKRNEARFLAPRPKRRTY
jgi:hypothetical protein